nr:DUF2382 domain-containing protein [uncultured Sphingosinicella sp.]
MTQVSGSSSSEEEGAASGAQPQGVPATSAPLLRAADRVAIFAQSYEFPETAEKLLVDKQLIVREELTVRKVVEAHTQQIDETVRRTEVEVERLPAASPPLASQAAPAPVGSAAPADMDRPLAREPSQETVAPSAPAPVEAPAQEVTFVDPAVANEPTGGAEEPAPMVFGLKNRAVSTAQVKEPPSARTSPAATSEVDVRPTETPPLVFGINDAPPARTTPREQAPAATPKSGSSDIPQSWWVWCAILSVLAIVLAFYGGSLLATL